MNRDTDAVIEMLFCRTRKLTEEATGIWISISLSFSLIQLLPSTLLPLLSFAPSFPSHSPSDSLCWPEELLVIGLKSKPWNTSFWLCLKSKYEISAANSFPPLYYHVTLDDLWLFCDFFFFFFARFHHLWQYIKVVFTYEKQKAEWVKAKLPYRRK